VSFDGRFQSKNLGETTSWRESGDGRGFSEAVPPWNTGTKPLVTVKKLMLKIVT